MVQETIALLIVFAAAVYTAINSYKFFFAAPKAGCGSGCAGCNTKSRINKVSHTQSFNMNGIAFNPKDLRLN